MDDVLSKHFTLERNLKILEYGNDLGQVVGTRVEPVPGTCIPLQAGGSHLVHCLQSKLPALGIALACSEKDDWYPLARLVPSAFFPGVENPDLATGMPRSPTNQDEFTRSPILVETKVANLRPDWCCTGNTRHFRNRRDRNVLDLVVYPMGKTLLRGYLDTYHNLLSDHELCVGCHGEGGRKLCRCRCRCGTFNHRCRRHRLDQWDRCTENTSHFRHLHLCPNRGDRKAHDLVCHGGNGRKVMTGRGKSRCWCR